MGMGDCAFLLLECPRPGLQHTRSCLGWHQIQKPANLAAFLRKFRYKERHKLEILTIKKTPIAEFQFLYDQ